MEKYVQFRACSIPLTSIYSLALISNEPTMPFYKQELIANPINIYLRTCCMVSAGHTMVSLAVSSYLGLAFTDVPTQQYREYSSDGAWVLFSGKWNNTNSSHSLL